MTKIAPNGCGKLIGLRKDGSYQIACGDHIDLENGFVQPVLCDECWDISK